LVRGGGGQIGSVAEKERKRKENKKKCKDKGRIKS